MPLFPKIRTMAEIEKHKKNPRSADKTGRHITPKTEKPKNIASRWYLNVSSNNNKNSNHEEYCEPDAARKPDM